MPLPRWGAGVPSTFCLPVFVRLRRTSPWQAAYPPNRLMKSLITGSSEDWNSAGVPVK